jgi:uncharacterized protein (UPF0248 family)
MQFTKKKKIDAMGENLRNAHALAKAVKFSLQIVKENYNLIKDPEDVKCIKEMLPKLNYFIKRLDSLYENIPDTKIIIKDQGGTSHSDEISLRLIEALENIYHNYNIKKEKI